MNGYSICYCEIGLKDLNNLEQCIQPVKRGNLFEVDSLGFGDNLDPCQLSHSEHQGSPDYFKWSKNWW